MDAVDGIGARLQVLHLVDLYAADLLGLLPSGTEGPGVEEGVSEWIPGLGMMILGVSRHFRRLGFERKLGATRGL